MMPATMCIFDTVAHCLKPFDVAAIQLRPFYLLIHDSR